MHRKTLQSVHDHRRSPSKALPVKSGSTRRWATILLLAVTCCTPTAIMNPMLDAAVDVDANAGDALSPDSFSRDTFAPDVFAPDVFVPDVFVPDVFVPDVFVPDTFAPDTFVPDTFAPDSTPVCTNIPESVLNPFAWYYQAESTPQTLSVSLDHSIPHVKQCLLTIDGESHLSQYDGYENNWYSANWRFDKTGQNYCGGGACYFDLVCPEGITIRYWIWRTGSITLRDANGTVSGTCVLMGGCNDSMLTHEVICNPH